MPADKLTPEEAHLGTTRMKFPPRKTAPPTSNVKPGIRIREVVEEANAQSAPPTAPAAAAQRSGPVPVQITLPSRFEFYDDIQSVFVRPMNGFHQSKFYRAAHEKSDAHVVNAINLLLSQDIGMTKPIDANQLTIPDFYFVMYWLRLNCYTKTPLVHRGICNHPKHLNDVAAGERPRESLTTIVHIKNTTLEQTDLQEDYLEQFDEQLAFLLAELGQRGLTLTAPRMGDVNELNDVLLPDNAETAEEIRYTADRAACLVLEDKAAKPLTLKQRIDIASELSVDVLDLLDEWRIRVSSYGVKESVKFKCDGCGAEVENPILISAHSFL